MTRPLLLFGLAPALLGGCQATHLLYVSDTVLGIDVAASAEGTGHLIFGYDRDTFALVPRKEEAQAEVQNDRFDAMSLAAVSCVYVDGLQEVRFNHFVATGDSAKYVATVRPEMPAPRMRTGMHRSGMRSLARRRHYRKIRHRTVEQRPTRRRRRSHHATDRDTGIGIRIYVVDWVQQRALFLRDREDIHEPRRASGFLSTGARQPWPQAARRCRRTAEGSRYDDQGAERFSIDDQQLPLP